MVTLKTFTLSLFQSRFSVWTQKHWDTSVAPQYFGIRLRATGFWFHSSRGDPVEPVEVKHFLMLCGCASSEERDLYTFLCNIDINRDCAPQRTAEECINGEFSF